MSKAITYHYAIEAKGGKKWVRCVDRNHRGKFQSSVPHRIRRLKQTKVERDIWA